jgi:hypothetical protein
LLVNPLNQAAGPKMGKPPGRQPGWDALHIGNQVYIGIIGSPPDIFKTIQELNIGIS